MSGSFLLDTNVAIGVLNQQVDLESRRGSGAEVFLSLTVVGELLYGAAKSQHVEANRTRVERLISRCPVLAQDLDTAWHYGSLKATLSRQGKPIPENDIWIAACALQYDLVVITRDRHFDAIDGIQIEAWS